MTTLFFIALLVLSTTAGYSLARALPWRSDRHAMCLIWPFAIMTGPFLFGFSIIIAIFLFDGASPRTHLLLATCTLIICLLVLFAWTQKLQAFSATTHTHTEKPIVHWIWIALFLACAAEMLVLAWKLPLVQNDPLEYALVGRAMYETRSLSIYPLLDGNISTSGFYAPWTHPPLYPALIYAMYALQGSAETAGWMKAIAPWFMLAAATGVIGLACLKDRCTGWVAGLFFLTTPLLLNSAQDAAIDALPVCGQVLLMAGIAGFRRDRPSITGMWIGLLAGLVLWTHSQAILYPLVLIPVWLLTGGLQQWRMSIRSLMVALPMMAVIAAYPYWRNLMLYGTLISDNPAVFALPSLDWNGFFKYTRGIYGWINQLQYGLFKGFSAIHDFGFSFWLSALAILYLLRKGMLRSWWNDRHHMTTMQGPSAPMLMALTFAVIYHAGVLLSILLGIDLMIKNNRYFLAMTPFVSIMAAWFVMQPWRKEGA